MGYVAYVSGWVAALAVGSLLFFLVPWFANSKSRLISQGLGWGSFLAVFAGYRWLSRVTGLKATERIRLRPDGHFYPPGEDARVRRHWRGVVGIALLCGALGASALGLGLPIAMWRIAVASGDDNATLGPLIAFFAPWVPIMFVVITGMGAWLGRYHYLVRDDGTNSKRDA